MKIILSLFLTIFISFSARISAQDKLRLENESSGFTRTVNLKVTGEEKDFLDFNSKYGKALILSAFVPGSGQVYLGNTWRGTAITLAFWGSAVTTILSHNNFTGREDRLKLLTIDYNAAGNYKLADKIWADINHEKANRDYDYKRRNIFKIVTALIYAYNIADLLFLTEDSSTNGDLTKVEVYNPYDAAHAGGNKLIELKYFLP